MSTAHVSTAHAPVIATVNVGLSTLTVVVRDPDVRLRLRISHLGERAARLLLDGRQISMPGDPRDVTEAIRVIADIISERGIALDAVAHRIAQGGPQHLAAEVIDDGLLGELDQVAARAPMQLRPGLAAIDEARAVWTDVPHIACFDTAFHHGLPDDVWRLPVPDELDAAGLRRHGSDGLVLQSVLEHTSDLGGTVVAHLGDGCSVTALRHSSARYTTASFAPGSGILSGTRAGDMDPEAVLYLIEKRGYDVGSLRRLLNWHSGLAGITGGRYDIGDLLADLSDARVDRAMRMFVTDVAMAIAGCATTLDRWDDLVFTGEIGEHAVGVREEICRHLLVLRATPPGDGVPSDRLRSTGVRVHIVPSDPEAVMDRLARGLLPSRPSLRGRPVHESDDRVERMLADPQDYFASAREQARQQVEREIRTRYSVARAR